MTTTTIETCPQCGAEAAVVSNVRTEVHCSVCGYRETSFSVVVGRGAFAVEYLTDYCPTVDQILDDAYPAHCKRHPAVGEVACWIDRLEDSQMVRVVLATMYDMDGRLRFVRGDPSDYTWRSTGNFEPSEDELLAVLYAQEG